MPATNPRLTITLKPSTAAQMRRLSELTGSSQSALISELLEANEQTFSRLILVLEAADAAKASYSEDMKGGLQEAQAMLERQLGLMLESVDQVTAPLLAEAEKVARRGRKRGPGGGGSAAASGAPPVVPTPISNRGVRSGAKTPKSSGKSRG